MSFLFLFEFCLLIRLFTDLIKSFVRGVEMPVHETVSHKTQLGVSRVNSQYERCALAIRFSLL